MMVLAPKTLEHLLERVRSALGPDEQLDRDLAIDLRDWSGFIQKPSRHVTEKMIGVVGTSEASAIGFAAWPEPVTGSIDSAVKLLHQVLPGWLWRVASCCVSDDAWVCPDFNDPTHGPGLISRFEKEVDGRDPSEEIMDATDVARQPPGQPALALLESILLGLQFDAAHPAGAP